MEITVPAKQLDVGDALKQHIKSHVTDSVEKYFDHALDANVVLTKEASGKQIRTDIVVHIARNIQMHGRASTEDAYGSFDSALERIAKQIRRYKRRLNDHRKKSADIASFEAPKYVIEQNPDDEDIIDPDASPVIIAEMSTTVLNLTVSEAVMHMDVNNSSALVFQNKAHGGINVVYRRADGNIGWLDPTPAKS
ncbi:MAG: ribosomal subunit interface protein [Rhodospirillaceae bacterium]|nr:ribosomal subunit interface protein [Rhodospirillaceae bacterium]|tara:strand:- start:45948 stop:46529 length:582 start_codon:yes stop_codon:yes gene_type:complete